MNRLGPFGENTIVVGDCLDVMAQMPDGCVDLVVTDPPYNISKGRRTFTRRESTSIHGDYGAWDHFEDDEHFLGFTNDWLAECFRLLKDNGSLYSYFAVQYISFLKQMWQRLGGRDRHTICWHKTNPPPHFMKNCFIGSIELISYMIKGDNPTFHFKTQKEMHNFIETPTCMGRERTRHRSQKREDVTRHLIEISSNPGDLIFDPFIGSGTTAVVADRLGRKFFGCDISEEYAEMALERLEKDRAGRQLALL